MADINLDLSGTQASGNLDVLPAGEYLAHVIESDIVTTKSGTGQYIKATFAILDGPFKGRKVWQNWNFRNANPEAQRIGMEQLKGFLEACGHPSPDRLRKTDEFHGRPVIIKVTVRKSDDYGDSNEIKGYKKVAAANGSFDKQFADSIPGF